LINELLRRACRQRILFPTNMKPTKILNGKCVCADLGLSASDPPFSVFQELDRLGTSPRETLYRLAECIGYSRSTLTVTTKYENV